MRSGHVIPNHVTLSLPKSRFGISIQGSFRDLSSSVIPNLFRDLFSAVISNLFTS